MTPAAAAIGALACVVLGSGCNLPGRRVYNLDALHDAEGRHKHVAGLIGDTEYVMREGFGGILRGFGKDLDAKEASEVEDPTEACLENLLGLLGADPRDPDVAAMQVELCARIVATDSWRLSRERATIGLGRAGERMRLFERPARTPGAAPISPEQLSDLLARFVKAVTPFVSGGDRAAAQSELIALAEEARGYEYDARGMPRVLRGVRLLAARLGRDIPELADLSLDLQARAIEQGLVLALADEDPFVAAAATWIGRRALGDAWCERVLARIQSVETPAEVFVAYADEVVRRGLPGGASRDASVSLLYSLSGSHADGRVRAAAMRALTTASGGELVSLREEDWQAWWAARRTGSTSPASEPKELRDLGQP